MTIKKLLMVSYLFLIIGFIGLSIIIFSLFRNQNQLNTFNDIRYLSYEKADELRQSSDELTRLARTYVITGNDSYEKMYWDVLGIRNGDLPRPVNYERIYWDLVIDYNDKRPQANGEKKALKEYMRDLGFTAQEFSLLTEAENNSNKLIGLETIAMNAVKGLFDDGSGNFTVNKEPDRNLAITLMHSKEYHIEKARIMEPINKFFGVISERTFGQVSRAKAVGSMLLNTAIIISVFMILCIVIISIIVIRSIAVPLTYVVKQTDLIATGNLNLTIKKSYLRRADEIGQVTKSLQNMIDKLSLIVTDVLTGSRQIALAGKELSTGNQDLSDRTVQQATALVETSSAVEEMSASIKSNADNTGTADQLSGNAMEKTQDGLIAVENMISSMNEISSSSDQIAAIIEVINNIAFQTNLLALNASIEAARAGEMGKGFAVVAVEVRKLAKRSDKAASEIATIIKDSNKKVGDGVKIANNAGSVLTEINSAFKKVAALIGEISAASQEQLSSVGKIDNTLSSLDQNTQRNAALVEEAAASTEELSAKAEELNTKMSFFNLNRHDE